MITSEQAEIIEQLISDCADEVDSDFYPGGVRVVARKLYRLATVIRAIRCGRGMDIVGYVGQADEWALRAGGVTRHG
jgi:hypothetical protein